MPTLETRLIAYLEPLTGGVPSLRDVPVQAGLPLFLRERYQFRRIGLFGGDCLLALEKPGMETGSPGEYAAHVGMMLDQISEPVTRVIPQVAAYARNRMVQAGTLFILPGSQLFMPFMMVDLRERFAAKGLAASRPTALPHHDYRTMLAKGEFREVSGPEDVNVRVEAWT